MAHAAFLLVLRCQTYREQNSTPQTYRTRERNKPNQHCAKGKYTNPTPTQALVVIVSQKNDGPNHPPTHPPYPPTTLNPNPTRFGPTQLHNPTLTPPHPNPSPRPRPKPYSTTKSRQKTESTVYVDGAQAPIAMVENGRWRRISPIKPEMLRSFLREGH